MASRIEKRVEKLTAHCLAHNGSGPTYGCHVCGKHLVKAEMFKCSRYKSISTVPNLIRRSTGEGEAIERSVSPLASEL